MTEQQKTLVMRLADAYANACFEQGLYQRSDDLAPEQAREALAASLEQKPQDDNDFPLGQACDLSGEGTCEACQ